MVVEFGWLEQYRCKGVRREDVLNYSEVNAMFEVRALSLQEQDMNEAEWYKFTHDSRGKDNAKEYLLITIISKHFRKIHYTYMLG